MPHAVSPKLTPIDLRKFESEIAVDAAAGKRLSTDLLEHMIALDDAIVAKDRAAMATRIGMIRADAVRLHPAFLIHVAGITSRKKGAGQWMPMLAVLAADLRVPEMLALILGLRGMPLDALMDLLDGDALSDAEDMVAAIAAEHPKALDAFFRESATLHAGSLVVAHAVELRLARAGLRPLAPAIERMRAMLLEYIGVKVPKKNLTEVVFALQGLVRAAKRYAAVELDDTIIALRKDGVAGNMMEKIDFAEGLFRSAGLSLESGRTDSIVVDAIEVFGEWMDSADSPLSPEMQALSDTVDELVPPLRPVDAPRLIPDYSPDRPFVRSSPKIGANEPCPCGSGKKYKKCCGR